MVEEFIRQGPLGCPGVTLWVIALKMVRVFYDIMSVDVASSGHIECVVDDRGRVMHPPILQVGALGEPVGLGVVRYHSPGVSCDREREIRLNMRRARMWIK